VLGRSNFEIYKVKLAFEDELKENEYLNLEVRIDIL